MLWPKKDAPSVSASWWNDNWSYRKAIVINSDYVTGDLTDFPVLISFTDANLGTHAQEDGDDIIFIDSEGKKLSHEIESFATSTGELVAWVKIPELSSTEDTVLSMYYGNAGVGSQQDATNVWDDNYMMVQHMASTSPDTRFDSTKNNNDGTTSGYEGDEATTTAKINGADDFDGINDKINVAHQSYFTEAPFTASFWIKHNTPATGNPNEYVLRKWGSSPVQSWAMYLPISSQKFTFSVNNPGWNGIVADSITATSTWYYFTAILDNNYNMKMYINGNLQNKTENSGGISNATGTLDISAIAIDGSIDEVRISNIARSTSSIETSFNNQNSPETFLSVQAEETGPGPVGYWTFDDPSTGSGQEGGVKDSSGQGNHGTNNGAVQQDESMCVSGKCLYFDGDDKVLLQTGQTNSDLAGASAVTFSFWVKPTYIYTDDETENNIFYGFIDGTTWNFKIGIDGLNNNTLRFGGRSQSGDSLRSGNSISSVATSSWVYAAGIYDYVNDKIYVYVNGHLDSTTNAPFLNTEYTKGAPTLSDQFGFGSTYNFQGFLDEFKIYPYARTADEIRQDYAAGQAGIRSNSGVSASFGSQSDSWMTDGLVGYWKMDESATTSGAIDASGNGNDGIYEGHASTTGGKFGNSGVFDGSGDVISCGSDSSLDDLKEFTISAWAKMSSTSDYSRITTKGATSLRLENRNGKFFASHLYDSGQAISQTNDTYSINTWYHIAAVYSEFGDRSIHLYIDGEEVQYSLFIASNGTLTSDNIFELNIGHFDVDNTTWNGQIDEVRIYNRALSPREVKNLYEWAPGPVAHWKFDEKTGQTAYDSAASTTLTGGNHGVLGTDTGSNSDDPIWTEGKYGGALQFDGSNDYLNAGTNSMLAPGSGNYTFSAWIKYNGESCLTGGCGIAGINVSYQDEGYFYTLDASGANLRLMLHDGTNFVDQELVGSTPTINKWNHTAFTLDSVNKTAYVYLNGVMIGTVDYSTVTGSVDINSGGNVHIGSRDKAGNFSFHGSLDDVRIYNYARTQKQILEDMAGAAPGGSSQMVLKQPVLDLSFDEGRGGTAYDKSVHGNHGTLIASTSGANTSVSEMWTKEGKFSEAIDFDGTDDYVEIGNESNFDFTESISISAWIYPRGSGSQTIVSKSGYGVDSFRFLYSWDETLFLEINDQNLYSQKTYLQNSWYYVSATYDKEYMKLYVNGALENSLSYTSAITTNNNPVRIGRTPVSYTYEFDGIIDEVKIYNYALSEDEIKTLYNDSQSAIMGSVSTATTSDGLHIPSNAASREYCVPGSDDYCVPPVLELKFDEKTGTTTYDTSGNGNDGYFVNTDTSPRWTEGKYGGGLYFDGSDDYVEIADGPSLRINNNMTINVWIKWHGTGAQTISTIMEKGSSDDDNYALHIRNNGKIIFEFEGSDSMYHFWEEGSVSQNEWHNIAIVFDDSNNKLDYYYNNNLVYSSSTVFSLKGDQTDSLYIAKQNFGGNSYEFNGLIDHIRVYDYARTPAQIAWEYNRGAPVAHWAFNECAGETIHDESCGTGSCNHGTLYLGGSGVTATGTCASSSSSTFWGSGTSKRGRGGGSFDGASDYIRIPDSSMHEPNYITMAAWINLDTNIDDWVISKQTSTYNDYDHGYLMRTEGGGDDAVYCRFGYGTGRYSTPYVKVGFNSWYHVVCTYDGSQIKIYLDGRLEHQQNATNPLDYTGVGDLVLAGHYNHSGVSLDGLLDDVKIWNYALTAEQVKTEYNGGAVRFGQ